MRLDADELKENSKLKVNKPKGRNNTIIAIVSAIIIITIIICAIIVMINELQPIDQTMKIYLDGEKAQMDTSIFLIENDKVYVSVKGIASYVGYESHSGEYKIEAEDTNKVFVENKQETASMFLNSTIISKIEPNTGDDYKNYTMSEPARNVNGDIYVISDGIEIACNIKLQYDSVNNIMSIQTLPYIYELYNTAVQKLGFTKASDNFENQKALLYDRIVIENSDGRYGVVDANGVEVIGTRYAYVQFDEYNKEFTITNAYNKVGIDYIDGETKINVNYDEIKSINKQNELYLVKSNEKYGVIDGKERIIIHMEYDDIGVDITPYLTQKINRTETTNNEEEDEKDIVKQYVFFNSLIAVKQNDMWGFFNIKGNKVSDIKYTDIGCKVEVIEEDEDNQNEEEKPTKIKTTGNLLLIDDYELIVVEQNEQYGLIDTSATELFRPEAEDMYSITDAGVKSYYMEFHGVIYNLEEDIFKPIGLTKKTEDETEEQLQTPAQTETQPQTQTNTQTQQYTETQTEEQSGGETYTDPNAGLGTET